jgi:hypothetical protein
MREFLFGARRLVNPEELRIASHPVFLLEAAFGAGVELYSFCLISVAVQIQ